MNLNLNMTETEDVDILTQRMRNHRNWLLERSDWSQVADAPVDRAAWAAYRRALRDFPATWTPGPEANFPEAPTQ